MAFIKVDPDAWQALPTSQEAARQKRRHWSACPRCSADLGLEHLRARVAWHQSCPGCGIQLLPVLWQRISVLVLSYILAAGVPAFEGTRGFALLFATFFFWVPALLVANVLFFRIISPKYIEKRDAVITLFRQ